MNDTLAILDVSMAFKKLPAGSSFTNTLRVSAKLGNTRGAINMIRDQVRDGAYIEVEIAIGRTLLEKILKVWPVEVEVTNFKKFACQKIKR